MDYLTDLYTERNEEVQQTNSNMNLVASWATNILEDAKECQRRLTGPNYASDRPTICSKLGEIIGECEAIIQAMGGRLK